MAQEQLEICPDCWGKNEEEQKNCKRCKGDGTVPVGKGLTADENSSA